MKPTRDMTKDELGQAIGQMSRIIGLKLKAGISTPETATALALDLSRLDVLYVEAKARCDGEVAALQRQINDAFAAWSPLKVAAKHGGDAARLRLKRWRESQPKVPAKESA